MALVKDTKRLEAAKKIYLNVRQNIHHLRKEQGLTQIEISNKLDVSQQIYSHLETGKIKPDLFLLIAFCKIFNVELIDLVSKKMY